jgi:hypothetical protein
MSGHNHIVGKRRCALLNHQKLKNILISPSKNEINADDWCFTQGKMDCLPNNMETHGYASNKRAICCQVLKIPIINLRTKSYELSVPWLEDAHILQ